MFVIIQRNAEFYVSIGNVQKKKMLLFRDFERFKAPLFYIEYKSNEFEYVYA